VAFNGDVSRDLATHFLKLAEKQRASFPLVLGHNLLGASLLYRGDFAEARAHLDQGIAHYHRAEHRTLATRFGEDQRVANLSFRSFALWMLGYPEASVADTNEALKDARDIGQAASLMFALALASVHHVHCGNYVAAKAEADELVVLHEERTFFYKTVGRLNQGCVLAVSGKASDAVELIISGITTWRSTGATLFMPWFLSNLARAHAELSQFDDAWRCIGDALTAIETTKEKWHEAEVNRIAGEIALKSPEPDPTKAETYFERALSVARQQQAKSWELRAAMSLARLWRDQGKVREARELLAPVYGWFTEGFETRDLKEAKALLEELAA
jgi:predicted ATPase